MNISIFGIGFPGDRPGYACLLELTGHIIKLQFEFEGNTLDELLSKCCTFKRDYKETYPIAGFVGRKTDAELAFIKDHNKNPLNEPIIFSEAPNTEKTGKISYHINSILNVMRNDNKRLYLQDKSKVLAYLLAIPKTETANITDRQQPAVAGLGYGVSFLINRTSYPETISTRKHLGNMAA